MPKLSDIVIPPWVKWAAGAVAVLALIAAVAFCIKYIYDAGATAERDKITSQINEKTVEKTREAVTVRNKAAARAAADDDDTAFERMRPGARNPRQR